MNKNKPMPVRIFRYGYEFVRLPRSRLQGAEVDMTIDPNVRFGLPTIKGTWLPLESLAAYAKSQGIEETCGMFEVSVDTVREAIEYINAMAKERWVVYHFEKGECYNDVNRNK